MSYLMRAMRPTDESFVLNAWKLQAIDALPFTDVARINAIVDAALRRSTVRVVCDQDDENYIMAFAAAEPAQQLLHCVYVKDVYRKLGIAKELLTGCFPRCKRATLWTIAAEQLGPQFKYSYHPSVLWKRDHAMQKGALRRA